MAKRLTKEEKELIIKNFADGQTIDEITKKFKCSKLTIIRNLKKNFGEIKFKKLVNTNKCLEKSIKKKEIKNDKKLNTYTSQETFPSNLNEKEILSESFVGDESSSPINEFIEITPLNEEIDHSTRKDLTSIPISEIDFPNTVFMIVDKKIELETNLLKHFPEWQFLPNEDLNRITIQIFYDLKNAKRICNKEQKVIKVPNTNVFKLVSHILISRGITRIVSEDQLIAL